MTELQYFRLFAPEFATMADADVNQWLAIAGALISVDCLDSERRAMANAYYAAHMIKLRDAASSGAAGAIISEKEGDLSRTYAQQSNAATLIGSTSYGQQYLQITRACRGAAIMTRGAQ